MKQTIKVYSKICLECHDKRWADVRAEYMAHFKVKEYRTALNPLWHNTATKLAGTEDYRPFILFPDGTTRLVKEVEDEKAENMPQMRRTAAKRPRMARVARSKNKTKKKAEEVVDERV